MTAMRLLGLLAALLTAAPAAAEPLSREALARMVLPPFELGEPVGGEGVFEIRNSGGAHAGYVFETEPMAPLPGFSGGPINALVTLDLEGRFVDVRLLSHNEPIFVSGLGDAPFHAFFEQYRGHSIADPLVVGSPRGAAPEGGALIYLDGVSKATASVRIAHESVLAATLRVAREKMKGTAPAPGARPDPGHDEALGWADLVEQGIVTRHSWTNADVQALFEGTIWQHDDPEAVAAPDDVYLDLWVADLGPPAVARAALSEEGLAELDRFRELSPHDEPVLVIGRGRHGLVSEDFVRNTAPGWISAEQGGLPVALRDADLTGELSADVPAALHDAPRLILRADRRLGFDPASPWTLKVSAVRQRGMFRPEIGQVELSAEHVSPERFFVRPGPVVAAPPWLDALRARQADLAVLAVFVLGLGAILLLRQSALAGMRHFTAFRLAALGFVAGFVGWWGQGQLSIVTALGVLRAGLERESLAFLVYDPFSLAVWVAALAGLVLWGRGFFCGWLCPFGALQEFAHHLGRRLRLPEIEPGRLWDARLRKARHVALAGLLATAVVAPAHVGTAAEIEPFKTAITVLFVRDWYYVLYAVFWLGLGLVLFKGFCRYLCPLGALLALGGALRLRDWIPRRPECGSPCQLCRARCRYRAIDRRGRIDYAECFHCLDCVALHDDSARCVPLVLGARGDRRAAPAPARREVSAG